jgi:hypothetical protein
MCGTVNPVGAPACSSCRAAGIPQMRLMFECPACHGLGLTPACVVCPHPGADDDLAFAEEVVEEPLSLDLDAGFDAEVDVESAGDEDEEDFDLDLGDEGEGDEGDTDLAEGEGG